MNTQVIKPPTVLPKGKSILDSVFLAGSIEMGTVVNWQEKITKELMGLVRCIFNPRRDDWDSSWHKDNPEFIKQVNWELNALDKSEHIFMYFDPKTKSPISLLELGLFASSGKLFVCCPEGFWRKGNVDIVCERYVIPNDDNLESAIETFKLLYTK